MITLNCSPTECLLGTTICRAPAMCSFLSIPSVQFGGPPAEHIYPQALSRFLKTELSSALSAEAEDWKVAKMQALELDLDSSNPSATISQQP